MYPYFVLAAVGDWTEYTDQFCSDNKIVNPQVRSIAACESWCAADSSCGAWCWHRVSNWCYKKYTCTAFSSYAGFDCYTDYSPASGELFDNVSDLNHTFCILSTVTPHYDNVGYQQ